MGNSGSALGVIAIILCAGVGIFAFFVWNGQNTTNSAVDDLQEQINDLESDFDNLIATKVVGIWDDLDENYDYSPFNTNDNWLMEFQDNNLTTPGYISVSRGNTRIALLQSGWYRIHISVELTNLATSSLFAIRLLKDGDIDVLLDVYSTTVSTSGDHHIDSSAFINSDGTNYIEVNGYGTDPNFIISLTEESNQFSIEYVASEPFMIEI